MPEPLSESAEEGLLAEQGVRWDGTVFQPMLMAARAILGQPDFENSARAILRAARDVTGAAVGYVALLSEDGSRTEQIFLDPDDMDCTVGADVPMPVRGMRAESLNSRRTMWENDFPGSPWPGLLPEGHLPLESVLFAPMLSAGRPVGLVGLGNKEGGFGEGDAEAAEAFAELAVVALTHAHSVQDLSQRAEKQAALYRLSAAAASSMDPAEVLNLALEIVSDLFRADSGWITLPGEGPDDVPTIAAALGLPAAFQASVEALSCRECPLLQSLFSRQAAEHELLSVDRCPVLPEEVLRASGVGAHITIPLAAMDSVLGAMHLSWNGGEVPAFDRTLALALGQQMGLALRNAQLYQAALHADHLRTLNDLDLALARASGIDALQERLLAAMARALRARLGAVFVVDQATNDRSLRVYTLARGWVRMDSSEPARRLVSELLHRGDAAPHPMVVGPGEFVELCPSSHLRLADGWGAGGIVAPIASEHRLVGIMALGGRPAGVEFCAEDLALVEAAATRAAQAMENALLIDELQERGDEMVALSARLAEAEESERRRLARELHDQVGQNLTALGLSLNLARVHLEGESTEKALALIASSVSLVEDTTESIRAVMSDLRPAVLDDYGIVAALRWYGDRVRRASQLPVQVIGSEPAPRLDGAVETAMFRVAQEALTNAVKHAHASKVTITLEGRGGDVVMTIEDDGVGLDPGAVRVRGPAGGWGLVFMKERCAAVGVNLVIDSSPGKGTRLVVEVPRRW